jgi:hypothetical protein
MRNIYVVVHQEAPGAFTWALIERKGSGSRDVRVAESMVRFADYDLALDAGFDALKALKALGAVGPAL